MPFGGDRFACCGAEVALVGAGLDHRDHFLVVVLGGISGVVYLDGDVRLEVFGCFRSDDKILRQVRKRDGGPGGGVSRSKEVGRVAQTLSVINIAGDARLKVNVATGIAVAHGVAHRVVCVLAGEVLRGKQRRV